MGSEFHLYNPNLHNHIVVLRKNKYYTFNVMHPDGRRLSTADLAAQLQAVITQAGPKDDLNVGILTADDRDSNLAARKQVVPPALHPPLPSPYSHSLPSLLSSEVTREGQPSGSVASSCPGEAPTSSAKAQISHLMEMHPSFMSLCVCGCGWCGW